MSYDLIKYASTGLIASGGIILYDVFVEGKTFSE
jgi:hypothetical protein